MSEKIGVADCELRNPERRRLNIRVVKIAYLRAAKDRHQRFDIEIGGGFAETNADRVIAFSTQVAPGALGTFEHTVARGLTECNPDSVEDVLRRDLETKLTQPLR